MLVPTISILAHRGEGSGVWRYRAHGGVATYFLVALQYTLLRPVRAADVIIQKECYTHSHLCC